MPKPVLALLLCDGEASSYPGPLPGFSVWLLFLSFGSGITTKLWSSQ